VAQKSGQKSIIPPIGVDDKVYIAGEHGKVVVLRAAGDWQIFALNYLDAEIYAPHVVSGDGSAGANCMTGASSTSADWGS
jgi:formylmethanofuran dehydrogenase subunit D